MQELNKKLAFIREEKLKHQRNIERLARQNKQLRDRFVSTALPSETRSKRSFCPMDRIFDEPVFSSTKEFCNEPLLSETSRRARSGSLDARPNLANSLRLEQFLKSMKKRASMGSTEDLQRMVVDSGRELLQRRASSMDRKMLVASSQKRIEEERPVVD